MQLKILRVLSQSLEFNLKRIALVKNYFLAPLGLSQLFLDLLKLAPLGNSQGNNHEAK